MGIFNHLFCVDINRGVRNFQDTPGAVLLDVRAPQLYARRHIPGSRNLPFAQLDQVGEINLPGGALLGRWGISCRTTTSPSSSAPTAGRPAPKPPTV